MALSLHVSEARNFGSIEVRVTGANRGDSTITIRRRIPPARRNDAALAVIPEEERTRLPVLAQAHPVSGNPVWPDYLCRANTPYEYQAREVYANGTVRSWSAWTG